MFDAENCYPRLTHPTSFHVTPADVVVQMWKRIPYPGNCRSITRDDLLSGAWLNQQGARILASCRGDAPASSILGDLLQNGCDQIASDDFWSFLSAAYQRGFLEFSDHPTHPTETRVTGDEKDLWPVHASFELTARCNLRCVHCYANATAAQRQELPTVELLGAMRQLGERGLSGVELTGGEPMLRPDFQTILNLCIDYFYTVAILTNGTLITDEFVRRISPHASRVKFAISLDGSSAQRHDAIRGQGAFQKTTRAIRSLADSGFVIRVGMSVGPYNSNDIEATGKLAADLGAAHFSASPVLPFGRGAAVASQLGDGTLANIVAAIEALPQVACLYEKALESSFQRMGNCGMGITNIIVTPTGFLKACSFLGEDDHLGNIREAPLSEILSSSKVRALAKLRAPEPQACSGCAYENYCRGCISRGMQVVSQSKLRCKWARDYHLERVFPSYERYAALESGVFQRATSSAHPVQGEVDH